MTRRDALAELIAKVESGDGDQGVLEASYGVAEMTGNIGRYTHIVDAHHGSLDAAKALHEAVLPKWYWHSLHKNGVSLRGPWFDDRDDPEASGYLYQDAEITGKPARAWLLAILRALHAQEGGDT